VQRKQQEEAAAAAEQQRKQQQQQQQQDQQQQQSDDEAKAAASARDKSGGPPPPPPPPASRADLASPPASGRRVGTSAAAAASRGALAPKPLSMQEELLQQAARRLEPRTRASAQPSVASSPFPSPPPSAMQSDNEDYIPPPHGDPPRASTRTSADIAKARAEANMQGRQKTTYLALLKRQTEVPLDIDKQSKLIKNLETRQKEYLENPPDAMSDKISAKQLPARITAEKEKLTNLEKEIPAIKKKLKDIIDSNQGGGSRKKKNNSSNKSKKNNKSSKRKTRKVTFAKNKKVKFIK
jgi:hypothetical protein